MYAVFIYLLYDKSIHIFHLKRNNIPITITIYHTENSKWKS